MYAEELNSAKSSVTLQSTDRHGFWDKSLHIFNYLCHRGKQSVRRIAHKTGCSKSRVHRLTQAMERRGRYPESWLWETEEGRQWLTRLVVATLYTFGYKRGVGMDTLSEFFARLHLGTQVGCSPSALRGIMAAVVGTIEETAQVWEQDGVAGGELREIIGAMDETFLEQMILVFQDMPTGYIVPEEVADDRTYATWKALVDERLKALGTSVLYLVSDRAKALIQLAEQGFECLSMPDFFHYMHDIVKSYSLTIARQLRHALQARTHAEAVLARPPGLAPGAPDRRAVQAEVHAKRVAVQRWEEVQGMYRHHLETLLLTLHPFDIADAAPQTSAQVHSQLQAAVEAIETLVAHHQLLPRHDAMKKVRKQLPALPVAPPLRAAGVCGPSPRARRARSHQPCGLLAAGRAHRQRPGEGVGRRPVASTTQRGHSRRDCGKIAFEIPSMLPLLSSPFSHFFLPSLLFLKSCVYST